MADDITSILKEKERLEKELDHLYKVGEGKSEEANKIRAGISDLENQIVNFQNKQESKEKTKVAIHGAASWTGSALLTGIGSNYVQILIGIILILAIITYFVTQSYIAIIGALILLFLVLIMPKLMENPTIKSVIIFGGIITIALSAIFFRTAFLFVAVIVCSFIFFGLAAKSNFGKTVALCLTLLMLISVIAMPTLTSQILSKGISLGTKATSEDSTDQTRKSIIDWFKELVTSFQAEQEKQKQILTGNYSEGSVQQTENPYGIKLMSPRAVINPETTNQNQQTEIFASLYGFSTENMEVDLSCYFEKTGKENSKITGTMITNKVTFDAGIRDVKDDIICRITPTETGLNEVTITATANNIATSSELENYFIDKTTYLTMKRSYEDQKGIIIETNEEAISALFPGYSKSVSVSEAGHLKLIISTTQNAIIPLANNDRITATVRFENTDAGLITGINYLKLEIPDGFKASTNCISSGWTQNGNQLSFVNLGSYDFTTIKKGTQGGVPSCQLEVIDVSKILINPTKPNLVKLKSSISYNYQVEFKKEIKVIETLTNFAYSFGGNVNNNLPNPEIQQKIVSKAAEKGVPVSLALALGYHESAGTFDQNIKPNENADSKDYGVFQINNKAHCEYFQLQDRASSCVSTQMICDAKNNVDCNIEAGLSILKSYYHACLSSNPNGLSYACNGKIYYDWDCALRRYNGLADDTVTCSWAADYVEKVKENVAKFT